MENKIEIVWDAEQDLYQILQSGNPQSVFTIFELTALKAEIDRMIAESEE